ELQALRSAGTGCGRIVGRGPALQPIAEGRVLLRQLPFPVKLPRHRKHPSARHIISITLGKQPGIEILGRWIVLDGAIHELSLHRHSEHVRRRVTLSAPAAAVRGFECTDEPPAEVSRTGEFVRAHEGCTGWESVSSRVVTRTPSG